MLSLIVAAALQAAPAAAPAPALPAEYLAMNGDWVVDLSVEPENPYTQPMKVTINPDRTITGEFYQSTIEQGRAGRNQDRVCISFQTSDGAGPYYHAACLVDDKMVGQSWAEHRKFVLPWHAVRAPAK